MGSGGAGGRVHFGCGVGQHMGQDCGCLALRPAVCLVAHRAPCAQESTVLRAWPPRTNPATLSSLLILLCALMQLSFAAALLLISVLLISVNQRLTWQPEWRGRQGQLREEACLAASATRRQQAKEAANGRQGRIGNGQREQQRATGRRRQAGRQFGLAARGTPGQGTALMPAAAGACCSSTRLCRNRRNQRRWRSAEKRDGWQRRHGECSEPASCSVICPACSCCCHS